MYLFMKQEMQLRKVQKRRDNFCWNETEEKFHDRYADIEKYETVEINKCVAHVVCLVPNVAGNIHNCNHLRRLVG